MSTLLHLQEPVPRPAPRGFALWRLGFRPFYLLAALQAAVSVPLWALQWAGWLPHAWLRGPLAHAHEMLFGFALAVIVGFLFTAGRNWSGRPTPTGPLLAALAALWLAGRGLMLGPWREASLLVGAAFPLAAAAALAVPFWAARSQRNYFFVGLLMLMAALQAAFHLAVDEKLAVDALALLQVALDVVMFIVAVMAGRVVPMFTTNAVPKARSSRDPRLEKVALGALIALIGIDALQAAVGPLGRPGSLLIGAVLLIAAAAHALRWWKWQPWTTGGVPLVWVLHAAYAWLPLHLLLRATALAGWVPTSLATHALTVGVVGGLIIGMMTRTARGHTARPLRADRAEVVAYALVMASALVRVLLPLVSPALLREAVLLSALAWSVAFAIYLVVYTPILMRPRLDGKDG